MWMINMKLEEAKQILNDNGYVLDELVEARRKPKPEPVLGIRRKPNGKCKPAFYTYEEAEELMRPRYLAMVEREKAERLAQSTRNMDSTAQPSLVLLQHFITNSTDSNGPFALENMICVVKCGMNVYSICYSAVPSYFKAYNQNFLQSLMSFQNGTRMTMQPRSYSNPTNVYGNNRSSSSGGLG